MPEAPGAEPHRPCLDPAQLDRFLAACPAAPVHWVACSGGLDSTVLLHLAAGLPAPRRYHLRAVHVHHGLHPDADRWTRHCESVCRDLGLPLTVLRVDARPAPGQSPEDAARQARYRALADLLGPGELLLLAQHQDDQAETLLLQLLRGAGVAGLAAMPALARLGPGHLARPLLRTTRAELADHARARGLTWVEDPSNAETDFDRNFLRRDVLPLLRRRWPALSATLSRTARHCAEADALLAGLGERLLADARAEEAGSLAVPALLGTTPAEQALMLRRWLARHGFRAPPARIVQAMREDLLGAAADRNPLVCWREGEVRRYRGRLYLTPPLPALATLQSLLPAEGLNWPADAARLALPGGNGHLRLIRPGAGAPGIPEHLWQQATVRVGYRRGGEALRLPGRQGRHELRKLFQERGWPPWVRERVPLVYLEGRLAAVGDWLAAEFAASGAAGPVVRPCWEPPAGLWPAGPLTDGSDRH